MVVNFPADVQNPHRCGHYNQCEKRKSILTYYAFPILGVKIQKLLWGQREEFKFKGGTNSFKRDAYTFSIAIYNSTPLFKIDITISIFVLVQCMCIRIWSCEIHPAHRMCTSITFPNSKKLVVCTCMTIISCSVSSKAHLCSCQGTCRHRAHFLFASSATPNMSCMWRANDRWTVEGYDNLALLLERLHCLFADFVTFFPSFQIP